MLKRIVKYIIIVIIIFIGCLFIICSSPKIMQKVLTSSANRWLTDMTVSNLVIEKQVCHLPRELTFNDISLSLKQKDETYTLSFKKIQITNIISILQSKQGGMLQLNGGKIKASSFQAKGLNASFVLDNTKQWSGSVSIDEAESNGFKATNIEAYPTLKSKGVDISIITGDSYKGKFAGQAYFYFLPSPRYTANVAFEGLNMTEMETINPSLFSQVQGEVFGTIKVQGPASGLEKITMNMFLGEDGKIQAKTLEPLLGYIPKSIQRNNLEKAIINNQLINVSNAQIKLANQNSDTIATTIQLASKSLNLDLNVTIDFKIEGGLQNLSTLVSQFDQLKKGQ